MLFCVVVMSLSRGEFFAGAGEQNFAAITK
jgi:hypothetical protein